MASLVRRIGDLIAAAVQAEFVKLRLDMLKVKVGTIFHADATTAISAADASDLATSIALANNIKAMYNAHCASACSASTGQGAHIAADATNPTAVADATDLTSVEALLNDIKSKYNSHRASTSFHPTADGTNVISSANATDQSTSNTLANELKTDINAHMAAAFNSQALQVVDP